MNALRRFEAGTASAKIAVAPVKAKLVVDRQDIKCDEPVKVSWQSTDAANTTVKANDQPLAYSSHRGNGGAAKTDNQVRVPRRGSGRNRDLRRHREC